ncbi:hypothetical protein WDW86_17985 [Bdellovibrionota bacterium FG-2]
MDYFSSDVSYRKYWSLTETSTLNLNLGSWNPIGDGIFRLARYTNIDTLPFSLGYGYDLKRHHDSDATQNARLNFDLGFKAFGLGYGSVQGFYSVIAPGARTGLTLDVPVIGTVKLFLLYAHEIASWQGQR